jgi:hypothetical protein
MNDSVEVSQIGRHIVGDVAQQLVREWGGQARVVS